MDDQFFIPRHDRKLLRDILGTIPALVEDLAVAITRQARLGNGRRYGLRSKAAGQPLPYDADAARVADELHAALVGWVRLVCEHRGLTWEQTLDPAAWLALTWVPGEFIGPLQRGRSPLPDRITPSSAELARWLYRHMVALAMTPGSEMALREIQAAARAAERVVCPPREVLPTMDAARVRMARALQLNARGIATLARDLGEEYRHLTQRRVHVLHEAGLIEPVPGPWRTGYPQLYRVGAVLDAHLALPIRQRHTRERATA